jgi:hypothetical protein
MIMRHRGPCIPWHFVVAVMAIVVWICSVHVPTIAALSSSATRAAAIVALRNPIKRISLSTSTLSWTSPCLRKANTILNNQKQHMRSFLRRVFFWGRQEEPKQAQGCGSGSHPYRIFNPVVAVESVKLAEDIIERTGVVAMAEEDNDKIPRQSQGQGGSRLQRRYERLQFGTQKQWRNRRMSNRKRLSLMLRLFLSIYGDGKHP